jgi:hypothetical protein
MKQKPKQFKKLHNQAKLIAADIADLMNQYTNDSAESKFYLPSEVSAPILLTAASFASQFYPLLDASELSDTAVFSMLYLAITYGFQVYLKELSIKTSGSPFSYPRDYEFIEKSRHKIYELADRKELTTTDLSDEVFELFLTNLKQNFIEREFQYGDVDIDRELFFAYIGVSLYWGYNFAKEVIEPAEGL